MGIFIKIEKSAFVKLLPYISQVEAIKKG